MKKVKESLKKGGIADIVTLVIIVGLAIGLVVAVVVPMINSSESQVGKVKDNMADVETASTKLFNKHISESGEIITPTT